MPIRVTTNLRVVKLKRGQIVVHNKAYRSILIGGGCSPGMQCPKAAIYIEEGGQLIFNGGATISQGSLLRCDKNACLEIGASFYCNHNCFLRSTSLIKIGKNCSFGWSVHLNTSDGHTVWHDGQKMEEQGPIIIGDKVWLTPDCSVLKNAFINNNCIVTQKSIITHKFTEENCLIGGLPARILRRNIDWKA